MSISKEIARYNNSLPSKDGGSPSSKYRQDLIVRMMNNEPGSGEELIAAAKGRGVKLTVATSKSGEAIGINVPENFANKTKAYTVYFNNPDRKKAYIELNSLISSVTGENVNLSTVMTDKGKGQVRNGKDVKNLKNEPVKTNTKKEIKGF